MFWTTLTILVLAIVLQEIKCGVDKRRDTDLRSGDRFVEETPYKYKHTPPK